MMMSCMMVGHELIRKNVSSPVRVELRGESKVMSETWRRRRGDVLFNFKFKFLKLMIFFN